MIAEVTACERECDILCVNTHTNKSDRNKVDRSLFIISLFDFYSKVFLPNFKDVTKIKKLYDCRIIRMVLVSDLGFWIFG